MCCCILWQRLRCLCLGSIAERCQFVSKRLHISAMKLSSNQIQAQVWWEHLVWPSARQWDNSNRKVERSDGKTGRVMYAGEWREWGWNKENDGLFTKYALCQSWKRVDKEKRKRREKKEWKSERLIHGQPQNMLNYSIRYRTSSFRERQT